MNLRRGLSAMVLAGALIFLGAAAGLPVLMAFTAQVVNLTARVVQRPTIEKFVVRDPGLSQADIDLITEPSTGVTGCEPADTEPPIEVPTNSCVWWVVRIAVRNNFLDAMNEVLVTDRFGAELAAVILNLSRGEAEVVAQMRQGRLTWCVTGPLAGGECAPGSGQLLPGDGASLDLLVFTKPNPTGRQEYTSPGQFELNSGATAKWLDANGVQCGQEPGGCPSTVPIMITAVCSNPCPSSTQPTSQDSEPSPEPTAVPGLDVTPEPTAAGETEPTPTPTETPAAESTPAGAPEPTPTPEPATAPTPEPTPQPAGGG